MHNASNELWQQARYNEETEGADRPNDDDKRLQDCLQEDGGLTKKAAGVYALRHAGRLLADSCREHKTGIRGHPAEDGIDQRVAGPSEQRPDRQADEDNDPRDRPRNSLFGVVGWWPARWPPVKGTVLAGITPWRAAIAPVSAHVCLPC